MSNFLDALPFVLTNEGWYSDVSNDTGGETWCGISRNNFPQWPGWEIVDAHKDAYNFPFCLRALTDLSALVAQFYETTFWQPMQAGQIADQDVATRYFDAGVNCGTHEAVKLLQRSVNTLHSQLGQEPLVVDGEVGPLTLAAVNASQGAELLAAFREQRRTLYLDIVAAHPSDRPFLYGWLQRAAR